MIWVIGNHYLKGRMAIPIDEDDDIHEVHKELKKKMKVEDIVRTDHELKEELYIES